MQKLLVAATDEISGTYADRRQTILREYYFQDRPAAVVWDQIRLTKNSFHLSRNAAIAALEGVLIARLQPALRLEQPPLPTALVERERVLTHCRDLLATPKTVALSGPGALAKRRWLHNWRRRAIDPLAHPGDPAGQPEAALALWRKYGAQEIAQGQAAAALLLFKQSNGWRCPTLLMNRRP